MLTIETHAVFRRDLNNCRTTALRESERARHAAYEVAFDRMVEEVAGMEANSRRYACDLLARLDGPGCLSGTLEYIQTREALARMGVTGANHIFIHDRAYIAATRCGDVVPAFQQRMAH